MPVAPGVVCGPQIELSAGKKKKNADGVTLMGINQTGDQASQNKPSRWALGPSVPGKASPLPGLGCPLQETPQRALQEPRGLFPDALLGSSQEASLGRIFISLSARAAQRSGEKEPLPQHFGPLVTERTDAGCCHPARTQQCTRAGGGDWGVLHVGSGTLARFVLTFLCHERVPDSGGASLSSAPFFRLPLLGVGYSEFGSNRWH